MCASCYWVCLQGGGGAASAKHRKRDKHRSHGSIKDATLEVACTVNTRGAQHKAVLEEADSAIQRAAEKAQEAALEVGTINVELKRHVAGKDRTDTMVSKSTATFKELKASVHAMFVAQGEHAPNEDCFPQWSTMGNRFTVRVVYTTVSWESGKFFLGKLNHGKNILTEAFGTKLNLTETSTLQDIMALVDEALEETTKKLQSCNPHLGVPKGLTLVLDVNGPTICPVCLERTILGYARDSSALDKVGSAYPELTCTLDNYDGRVVYFFDDWAGPIKVQCGKCWNKTLATAGKTLTDLTPNGGLRT